MDNKMLKKIREQFKKETGKKVGELGKVYSLEYTQWLQKELVKKLTIPVNDCSEQWHVLSANMGDGKCSQCGKTLTELNYENR